MNLRLQSHEPPLRGEIGILIYVEFSIGNSYFDPRESAFPSRHCYLEVNHAPLSNDCPDS